MRYQSTIILFELVSVSLLSWLRISPCRPSSSSWATIVSVYVPGGTMMVSSPLVAPASHSPLTYPDRCFVLATIKASRSVHKLSPESTALMILLTVIFSVVAGLTATIGEWRLKKSTAMINERMDFLIVCLPKDLSKRIFRRDGVDLRICEAPGIDGSPRGINCQPT